MSARWLVLHLRSRRVPAVAAGVALVSALAAWSGSWLMERPFISEDQARIPVAALGTLLVAGIIGATLGSPDEWLDRSTPAPWARIRATHLVLAAGLGGGLLAIAGLSQPEYFGAPAMARGVVGLIGLEAIAALVIGARPVWLAALAYTSIVYLAAPRNPGGSAAIWAWPMQPVHVAISFAAAGGLFALGVLVHAWLGVLATSDVD